MNIDAWRYYLRARLRGWLRRPQSAIAEYRLALRHDPVFRRALAGLAFLLAQRGEDAEAIELYRQVLKLAPGDAGTWFNLGFLHERRHERPEAIGAFREAVKLRPGLDRAWYGLGLCEAALGRDREAAEALARAAELQPMNPHAWYELGLAYHRLHLPDKVREVAEHMNRFDRSMTRRLILETQRADLSHLVSDLRP